MTPTQNSTNPTGQMRCAKCSGFFSCGVTSGGESCWCFMLPRVMPLDEQAGATGCLCPDCLRAAIQQQASLPRLDVGKKPHA